MKKIAGIILLSILFCTLALCAGNSLPYVVTTQWLADHLNDPNLVILHVTSHHKQYLTGHIPGAQFLWPDWFAADNPDLSYELAPVDDMKDRLEKLGVSDNSTVVLCFTGSDMTITSRMFFTLDYLGFGDHTRFLDGGFEAWKKENRKISTDTTAPVKGTFTPHINKDALTDGDWIETHLHTDGVHIVDARSSVYYTGANPTWNIKGHIPGAVSIPFNSVADTNNKFKDPDSLRAIYQNAGIKPGEKIIPYCHVGQQASLIYFVAKNLAYNVSFYDGAFEDWSTRKDAPVEASLTDNAPHAKPGEKIVYVCSMDKDVVSDKPGNCPKCGMALEAKSVPVKTAKQKKS